MTNAITLKIFGQNGCQPCTVLKAVIEGEREDIEALGVAIEQVDLTPGVRDDRADLIAKYGIMSTPVTVLERNGHVMATVRGLVNVRELYDIIEHAKTAK